MAGIIWSFNPSGLTQLYEKGFYWKSWSGSKCACYTFLQDVDYSRCIPLKEGIPEVVKKYTLVNLYTVRKKQIMSFFNGAVVFVKKDWRHETNLLLSDHCSGNLPSHNLVNELLHKDHFSVKTTSSWFFRVVVVRTVPLSCYKNCTIIF